MSTRKRRVRDKWRRKSWYTVKSPPYFGEVELGALPSDEPSKIVGRVVGATLYDVTDDFSHQYLKIYFRVTEVEGKTANTIFRGHEYSRDYLRSLIRRRTTRVDGIFDVTTKNGYRLRLAVCALTLGRIKTSQEKMIRVIMKRIVEEKAGELEFKEFVQEIVLGKLASDVYNEAKEISPLRHVGVRKSRLLLEPAIAA
ncbi:MAG: 30S ribosomal protein S3ae [Candidatus Bathyarchaeota archaeon]|nr:MAG: 30S ribosomal protein S3ae [Candidatus Bathyarchaeota archaeon]